MKCPICGSENVTPSHRRGLEKIMQFLFPRTPYRCKECWSRFWTGQFKGVAFKVALVVAVLLFAIFYILPLDQLFKKSKDNQPVKTISKSIEKPDKTKPDKGDKPPIAAKGDKDDDDEGNNLKIAKNTDDKEQPFKSEDLIEEAPVKPDKSAKPVKPIKDDKSKPLKADKPAKEKAVKPAVQKKTDDISDEEHEASPAPPQVTKLKEPNVEIPKPGKTAAKAESKAKTVLPKTEVKEEDKKEEVNTAEKEEEKAVLPTNSPRKMKEIKASASENSVDIVVSADGPIKDYKNFFLLKETPPKLVVDVKGKWKYLGKPAFDVDSELVSKVRVAEHNEKGFFRIVMDLKVKEGMTPVFSEDSKGLTITVKK